MHCKVIRRLVTGRRRDDGSPLPDVGTCLGALRRALAWRTAESDPLSGIGMWRDDVAAPRPRGRLGGWGSTVTAHDDLDDW